MSDEQQKSTHPPHQHPEVKAERKSVGAIIGITIAVLVLLAAGAIPTYWFVTSFDEPKAVPTASASAFQQPLRPLPNAKPTKTPPTSRTESTVPYQGSATPEGKPKSLRELGCTADRIKTLSTAQVESVTKVAHFYDIRWAGTPSFVALATAYANQNGEVRIHFAQLVLDKETCQFGVVFSNVKSDSKINPATLPIWEATDVVMYDYSHGGLVNQISSTAWPEAECFTSDAPRDIEITTSQTGKKFFSLSLNCWNNWRPPVN